MIESDNSLTIRAQANAAVLTFETGCRYPMSHRGVGARVPFDEIEGVRQTQHHTQHSHGR